MADIHEPKRCMSEEAMQALNTLRENNLLCDAVLRTDDGSEFHVHRNILSACSEYFLALFTTSLHSAPQSDVTLKEIDPNSLLLLIEYAYLRRIEINDANVHLLLITADYLSFLKVLELCCEYLQNNLSTHNCLGTMLFARGYFCQRLEKSARMYALRYFAAVGMQSEEFVHLSAGELGSIIMEDELNAKEEETVWEAVVRWIDHEPEKRKPHIVTLLKNIRLGLMETNYLLNNVKDHPYVTADDATKPILVAALKFMNDLESIEQSDCEFPTPTYGRPRIPHEVLFAIGGWCGGSPTSYIETYDTRADRWIRVDEVDPIGPRAYHGTVVLGHCVYVIGGFNGVDYFNSCRCFNVVTKVWREVAPMNARRCYVSVAVVGETIYAIGGYDGHHRLNTAERFNHVTNQWSMISSMAAQRSDASACTLRGKIYITGGFNGHECLNSAEVYDPSTDQWTILPPMRSRRSGVSCVAYHDKIYVIGGFNGFQRMASGEMYDPTDSRWSFVPEMNNQRSNFAIEVIDDMIFAIGGFNGVTTICQVECFDDHHNNWLEATDMDIYRSALSACVISGLPNIYDYIHRNRDNLLEEKKQRMRYARQNGEGMDLNLHAALPPLMPAIPQNQEAN